LTRLAFTIPGPIVPWRRGVPFKGRVLTDAKHRDYMRHVRACGELAVLTQARGRWPMDAVYDVTLHIFFQDLRTRDLDNCEKIFFDATKAVLWKDDAWKQFRAVHKYPALDRKNPRIEVDVAIVEAA
jgi:Holliday junction resolvase RusA-like endonuclease